MGPLGWTLLILALLATIAVSVEAIRRPILWRMAARNARRRPRQTATVVAGLMIGTAIISAALIAGGSAGSAIRGAVYDALGDVDETVRMDVTHFFPEEVYHEFGQDPRITEWFDGLAPNAIWFTAANNPRNEFFEPTVAAVGYDPQADAAFRPFILADGTSWDGRGLQPGEAVITGQLAEELDLGAGDTVRLRFTSPMDPLVPDIQSLEGVLLAGVGGGLLDEVLGPTPATSTTHMVTVDPGATGLTVVLGWDPALVPGAPPTTQLTMRLEAPDGTVHAAPVGAATLPPTVPLWLNVSADGTTLPAGDWQLSISATAGAQVPYQGAAIILYPVYDQSELLQRTRSLQEDLPELGDLMDRLEGFGTPRELELQVRAIAVDGRAKQFDFGSAVFLRMDEAQLAIDRVGQINVIKLSNPGGIEEGWLTTDEAMQRINATLADIQDRYPDHAAIQALGGRPVKQMFIEIADDAGELMTGLLLFAGSLTIITGLLLIINIFTMLAEERRSELGMARAVGLSRRDLVRLFLFEGSLYAVAAAAVGAVLGLGLAAAMIAILNAILQNLGSSFPPVPYRFRFDSLLVAFAAGSLLTFVTIAVASRRIAGLNIVRAIRSIEEPERTAARWQVFVGIVMAWAGAMALVLGWIPSDFDYRFSLQVFGAMALVAGAGMALRRWVRRKPLHTTLAAALGLYYATTYFLITRYDNIQETNIVGPIRGVLLTLCVVVLVVYFERGPRLLARALSGFKRLRAIVVTAFSYPLHKRFRTGMTLAMFSIVLLSIGFFSIFGGLFDTDPERQTGGFDIQASTTLRVASIDDYDRGTIPDGTIRDRTDLLWYYTPDVELITVNGQRTGQFKAPPHHIVWGYDDALVDAGPFRLLWRLDGYDSDEAAYQAVLDRDDVIIVSYVYSTDERNQDLSFQVGDTLQLHLGSTPREYTIIGIQDQWHFGGVWLGKDALRDLFPSTLRPYYLYHLEDGVDPVETARLLQSNYQDAGMRADASRELVLKEQEAFRQVLTAMKLFLGLGLIIGVLSLGIVTSRSVLERRQEIGMLRALGYTRAMIRRTFLLEVTVVIAVSAVIGVLCSILVTYGLWWAIIRELQYPYVIPWGEIAILLTVSYLVALAATLAPIRRAARVAPAEALRYLE